MRATEPASLRVLLDFSPEEGEEFRRLVEELGSRRVLEYLRQERAEREAAR